MELGTIGIFKPGSGETKYDFGQYYEQIKIYCIRPTSNFQK